MQEERNARSGADKQHDAEKNQHRAESGVEGHRQELRQERLQGELVLERIGNRRVVGESVGFLFYFDHCAAGVFHAGRRIDDGLLDYFIVAKFFEAGDDGPKAQPGAENQECEGVIEMAATALALAVFAGATRFFSFSGFGHEEVES